MAAVQITSANSNDIFNGDRKVVRTSTGILYVGVFDADDGGMEIWKGGTDGSSWTEQDASNNPQNANYTGLGIAIDSADIIHIAYWDGNTAKGQGGLRYVKFHTADAATNKDTFQGDELALAKDVGTGTRFLSISIDSSDIPHVAYVDRTTNMGTDYNTVYYTNRIGGSWKAAVEVEGQGNEKNCLYPTCTISDENVLEVSYINQTDADIGTALANVNDATSFTLFDIETSASGGFGNGPSIAIDSSGNTYVAFIDSTNDLNVRKHNDADSWTTWQSTETVDSTNNLQNPSIVINGTDIYIFCEDTDDADIVYYLEDGSGWSSQNSLEVGTYGFTKAKWSFNNNNEGDIQIDYIFRDEATLSEDVFWNKLSLAQPFTPKVIMY